MNAENYTLADWQTDIQAAQDARIALNMAVDSRVAEILPTAFQAAHDKHFSLFFSFDYAGNGPWKAGDVAALLEQYTASRAYYLHKGQYLVSTFEGPAHAEDQLRNWVVAWQMVSSVGQLGRGAHKIWIPIPMPLIISI
jgi:uncharacterized membrane protein